MAYAARLDCESDLDHDWENDRTTLDCLLDRSSGRVPDTSAQEIGIYGMLERGDRLLDTFLDDRM